MYRDRAAKFKKMMLQNYNNNINTEDFLRGIEYNFQLKV